VHTSFRMSEERMTERMIAAMEHPLVDAIGHPTGRKILSRDPYHVDVERLIATAAETGTMLEINAAPDRRDLNDLHARAAAEAGVPAIAMHYQRGRDFHDTIGDISVGLLESLRIAREQGLPDERVIIDPGFNFGWTEEQALEMLHRLRELRALGRPILIGTSRKSVIGKVLGDLPIEERLEGTAATVAIAIAHGADIVRVHDVKAMARVARMTDAIVRGWKAEQASP